MGVRRLCLGGSILVNFRVNVAGMLFVAREAFTFVIAVIGEPVPIRGSFSITLGIPRILRMVGPTEALGGGSMGS